MGCICDCCDIESEQYKSDSTRIYCELQSLMPDKSKKELQQFVDAKILLLRFMQYPAQCECESAVESVPASDCNHKDNQAEQQQRNKRRAMFDDAMQHLCCLLFPFRVALNGNLLQFFHKEFTGDSMEAFKWEYGLKQTKLPDRDFERMCTELHCKKAAKMRVMNDERQQQHDAAVLDVFADPARKQHMAQMFAQYNRQRKAKIERDFETELLASDVNVRQLLIDALDLDNTIEEMDAFMTMTLINGKPKGIHIKNEWIANRMNAINGDIQRMMQTLALHQR